MIRKKQTPDEIPANESQGDESIPRKFSWREKRRLKKEMRKMRPLWKRIIIQVLKTLFIRIPLTIIAVVALALFILNFYLTPGRVQSLAISSFAGASYGSLSLEVEKFNVYHGFVINNIVVRSGEDFGNEKVFEMERLVLDYSFFPIFTGSVRFPEIGLYKPRVYLTEKKGVWNVAALMKPSEKKPEEPEPEEKEKEPEGEPSKEISLPISVDFLLKFVLDDLRVYVKGADFSADLQGLTFNANIEVPPFKKIPKSVEAVRIIKTMMFELNPMKIMDVNFYSNGAATAPELVLNWKFIFNNGDKPEFNSKLEFGAKKMPLRLQKKVFSPLDFMISYDIFLNPIDDSVKISDFTVNFKGSNWLKLGGTVDNVTKKQALKIDMKESRIPLKDIYPYYVLMTGDRATKFSGEISLYPLTVRGTVENPSVKGGIALKGMYFKIPGTEASIPSLLLDYYAYGPMSHMELGLGIKIPHLAYVIDGSKSGGNGLKFNASISALNSFKEFRLNSITLDFYDPASGRSAVQLAVDGDVNLDASMAGWIRISKLRLYTAPLADMVPGRFQKQVAGIPLKKPVNLSLYTKFYLGEDVTTAGLDLFASIPDYGVEDLRLSASVKQDNRKKRVTLDYLTLGSKAMNLLLTVKGTVDLKKAPMSDSDIKIALELNNKAMKNVFGPWATAGLIRLYVTMEGDLETGVAKGNLVFKDFSLKNDEMKLALNEMNMDFPFEYELAARKSTKSYLTITQDEVIESEHFKEQPNFTIKSLKFKHPARERQIELMKDFSALMYFRDNVFQIADLKASIFDGSLYGRSIMFNLADFNTRNMEFNLILDMTNVNIGRMDEPNTSKVIPKDAELSLSANFSGKGLDINKELTVSGYINIYEIGNEFANRLMKGLSQEKGKSKLGGPVQFVVDNSMTVEKFDFKLDKGLAYPTVKLKDRFVGKFVSILDEEIKFDRIPVQEYLRKVTED